jgi:hypothetical protein
MTDGRVTATHQKSECNMVQSTNQQTPALRRQLDGLHFQVMYSRGKPAIAAEGCFRRYLIWQTVLHPPLHRIRKKKACYR